MNLYEAVPSPDLDRLRVGSQEIPIDSTVREAHPALIGYAGKPVVVGIRPEGLSATDDQNAAHLRGEITMIEALGNEQQIHFKTDAKRILAEGSGAENEIGSEGSGVARVGPHVRLATGETINLTIDTTELHFFDPQTGNTLRA
jgi:multiple sugar transport system ATP-binding protein